MKIGHGVNVLGNVMGKMRQAVSSKAMSKLVRKP